MRIAVLGAGIVGLCTAEWLRRDGHEVTLIDRVEPGDPAQASFGNAGVLAGSGVVPVPVPGLIAAAPRLLFDPDGPLFLRWGYLPRLLPWLVPYLMAGRRGEVERISRALAALVSDTLDQHRALARGTGAEGYIASVPYTYLYRDREAYEADALGHALRRAAGIEARERDRAALEAADPHLGPRYGFGLAFAGSTHLSDPAGHARALFAHYRRHGGGFRRAPIEDLRARSAGLDVIAGGDALRVDHAVIALGAWSGRFVRRLGHRPGLETERGYHLMLRGPSHRPPVPYMLKDSGTVATPMAGGLRLAGLVEFGGLAAGPSPEPTALQRRRARDLYPGLDWQGEEVWMGHRPTTRDSLPFIGESPAARGVWFAFGHQHLGLTAAPKTGRLIADMIAGRRPNIDLTPYRVGRFDG